MDFGAINNGCVLVGVNLTILGVGVIPLEVEVYYVFIYGKTTGAMGVVSSLMTSVLKMLATAMTITFKIPSKSTMTSLKNWREIYTQASISNGTTPIAPVDLPWINK